jgi:hypothetical protein
VSEGGWQREFGSVAAQSSACAAIWNFQPGYVIEFHSDGNDLIAWLSASQVHFFPTGNTCYMNSLLQSMFNAESFRKAVILECEKEGMAGKPTLLSSLQSLFENMSKGQGHTASTRPLASLLGLDPRIQQDAQEFGRLFFMELESEARGQGWAGVVQAVEGTFKGTMENYIEVRGVLCVYGARFIMVPGPYR